MASFICSMISVFLDTEIVVAVPAEVAILIILLSTGRRSYTVAVRTPQPAKNAEAHVTSEQLQPEVTTVTCIELKRAGHDRRKHILLLPRLLAKEHACSSTLAPPGFQDLVSIFESDYMGTEAPRFHE